MKKGKEQQYHRKLQICTTWATIHREELIQNGFVWKQHHSGLIHVKIIPFLKTQKIFEKKEDLFCFVLLV